MRLNNEGWIYIFTLVGFGFLAVVFSHCVNAPTGDYDASRLSKRTITLEGCSYIEVTNFRSSMDAEDVYSLTHKGNCRNPEHLTNLRVTVPELDFQYMDVIKDDTFRTFRMDFVEYRAAQLRFLFTNDRGNTVQVRLYCLPDSTKYTGLINPKRKPEFLKK